MTKMVATSLIVPVSCKNPPAFLFWLPSHGSLLVSELFYSVANIPTKPLLCDPPPQGKGE